MTVSSILSTALTGIQTSQAALRNVANNIANVNTVGYARQVAQQENIVVSGRSAGVQISNIQRIVDRFLEAAGLDAASAAESALVSKEVHDRFQGLIGAPDSESLLTSRLDRLFSSIAELSLNTSDQIRRQAMLASMQDVTDEIARIAQAVQDLRADVNIQIEEQVAVANEALRRVNALNPQIVRQQILGSETAGLESQRAQALSDLAKVIDIRITDQGDGSIGIATTAGAVLLDKSISVLEYRAPGTITAETRFQPITIQRLDPLSGTPVGLPEDLDRNIRDGRLRGLLDLRDGDLRNLSLTLGEFASNLIDEFNAVHNAQSAVPAPNQLSGRQTTIDGAHTTNFTGVVTFAVVDAANLLVASTTVDFTAAPPADFNALIAQVNAGLGGAGTLALTNGVMSLTATNAADGVAIADDLVDPSRRAGMGFSHFFGMNDLLEAGVEANYDTGFVGTDAHNLVAGGQLTIEVMDSSNRTLRQFTLNVVGTDYNDLLAALNDPTALGQFLNFSLDADGALDIAEQPGFGKLEVFVLSDTTNLGGTSVPLSRLFGMGDRYQVNTSRDIGVIKSIFEDPGQLSLAGFDLTALVGDSVLGSGDQTGALAFQKLATKLANFDDAGELSQMSASLGQYVAAFFSNAGQMGRRATTTERDNRLLLSEINSRRSDISGVNIDEELAMMVVLQTAFNASARLMTTAQQMTEVLFNAVL